MEGNISKILSETLSVRITSQKNHSVKEVSRRKTDPDCAYVPFLISIEANCSFHNTPNNTFIPCGSIKR